MSNIEITSELKKLNLKQSAFIILEVKDLIELRLQTGKIFNKNFTCEVKITWASAELESEVSLEELINLIEKKSISGLCNENFKNFSILKTSEGSKIISSIKWDPILNESEKAVLDNYNLEWESDIIGTKLNFSTGSVNSINIEQEGYNKKFFT